MASRFWLRVLPLRHCWEPMWLREARPASRLLWPGTQSLLDRMVQDLDRQMREMERMSRAFLRPSKEDQDGVAPAKDDGKFRLVVDAAGFGPEEMTVKLDGRKLSVEAVRRREGQGEEIGQWEERREWRRETLLPPDVDLQAVACSLDKDGRLCVEAPRTGGEKTIPIDVKEASDGGEKPKEA